NVAKVAGRGVGRRPVADVLRPALTVVRVLMADFRGNRYKFLQELESLGEEEVRRRLPSGDYGDVGTPMREVVNEWLAFKESEREAAAEARSEARAAEALSISREANLLSRKALI